MLGRLNTVTFYRDADPKANLDALNLLLNELGVELVYVDNPYSDWIIFPRKLEPKDSA